MGYAVFGLPIFMLWLSNVGTLLAQTFTFLYANVCCFICRRGKRKKGSWRNSIVVAHCSLLRKENVSIGL